MGGDLRGPKHGKGEDAPCPREKRGRVKKGEEDKGLRIQGGKKPQGSGKNMALLLQKRTRHLQKKGRGKAIDTLERIAGTTSEGGGLQEPQEQKKAFQLLQEQKGGPCSRKKGAKCW